jgi:hypothetical protein
MKKLWTTLALALALIVPTAGAKPAQAAGKHPVNACGCYGEANSCICERKAKCGCPGECEPKGCEEARQKQMQKEIDVETKKAKEQEEARKPKDEAKGEEAAEKDKAAKPAVKPMTAVQKKQFLKLLETYLAEHPEAQNKMLSEVRAELQ